MPRRRRYAMADLVFHVFNRGSRRGPTCTSDDEFLAFERVLAQALQWHLVDLFEYCLMGNHFHLIVRSARESELPEFMKWLTSVHAMRWRRANGTSGDGAVYQGRYRAVPVQADDHFYTLARYVQRNPVRARLVDRAELWRWGSLWHRTTNSQRVALADWPVPTPPYWLDIVNTDPSGAETDAIRQSVNRGLPLGNPSWQRKLTEPRIAPEFD